MKYSTANGILTLDQIYALYRREEVKILARFGVPVCRVAELFGEFAVEYAKHFKHGEYWNVAVIDDKYIPYLTCIGFQAAASFYNAQQFLKESEAHKRVQHNQKIQKFIKRRKNPNNGFGRSP